MVKRVLVAEDEQAHFKIVEMWLRKYGHDVIAAETLVAAMQKTVDLTEEEAERLPDLVITDLRLGKDTMAGLHFAWMLRGCPLTAHIPVIITTATADDALRKRLTAPGFPFPVVEKPYEPFRLAQLVKQKLEESDKPEGAD